MKKSASSESFYREIENGSHDSTHSSLTDDPQHCKTASYDTSKLQTYSSFPSSAPTRGRGRDVSLPSAATPLLYKSEDGHRHSSHYLLPSMGSSVLHEFSFPGKSSAGQAVLNGINVMCGSGILSIPYAAKEGGWLGVVVLLLFSVLAFYTGLLLRHCLDSEPGLRTYADIGQAAFGRVGRIVVIVVLYSELYATCVGFIIMSADNLTTLFPNAQLSLGAIVLDPRNLFSLVTTLVILPSVWLHDLRFLSYISASGVGATLLVVLCLFWVGLVDNVGSHSEGTLLNVGTFPIAVGIYSACYSGHAVIPNIYSSMAQPKKYPAVLFTSFFICTFLYAAVAVWGYTMLGESAESQFTMNMPNDLLVSKIAIWTTVVTPLAKYALSMTPVAISVEELLPSKRYIYSICTRTALVISTLIVGLAFPSYGLLVSLIGSSSAMFQVLIIPCACYLGIFKGKITRLQATLCTVIIGVAAVVAVIGTYASLSGIIDEFSG